MALRLVQIAMNARDDSAVGRFWAEALGWSVSSEEPGVTNVEPAGFAYPAPVAVCMDVLAVPEPKTVRTACMLTPPPAQRPIRRTWSRAYSGGCHSWTVSVLLRCTRLPGAGAWSTTRPSTGIGCGVSRIGARCRPTRPATSMQVW